MCFPFPVFAPDSHIPQWVYHDVVDSHCALHLKSDRYSKKRRTAQNALSGEEVKINAPVVLFIMFPPPKIKAWVVSLQDKTSDAAP